MRFGSLFSGIGGFDYGLQRAGWECAWQIELDRDCNRVLAHHWPEVPRYADVRDVHAAGVRHSADAQGLQHRDRAHPADSQSERGRPTSCPDDGHLALECPTCLPAVDLVVGGFPCQDLSVAGRRAGLAGERSGLWHEFRRVVAELAPRWVLVENVPGLFSSNQGEDFAVIVAGLVELGYGVAWRVLDAQHFGVPQRRRRVFVVGHLGAPWSAAAAVLLEPESLRGDTAESRSTWEDTSHSLRDSSARGSDDADRMTFVPETTYTLPASADNGYDVDGTGQGVPLVAHSLRSEGADASEDGTGRGTPIVVVEDPITDEELFGPSDAHTPPLSFRPTDGLDMSVYADIAPSLKVGTGLDIPSGPAISSEAGVRRLTPLECERLMGFPDGWTAVDGMSDSARYRMCGNAVVMPVAQWIGERLMAALR